VQRCTTSQLGGPYALLLTNCSWRRSIWNGKEWYSTLLGFRRGIPRALTLRSYFLGASSDDPKGGIRPCGFALWSSSLTIPCFFFYILYTFALTLSQRRSQGNIKKIYILSSGASDEVILSFFFWFFKRKTKTCRKYLLFNRLWRACLSSDVLRWYS
jgi:hypothetical protein